MSDRTVCFVTCLRAELMLGLSDAVLHPNQCFTKNRKVRIFIFSLKGLPFSRVNSQNEIYRYEYIL